MIRDEVLRSFAGRNVLVTGGTGLIGRQVVKLLCDAGATVVSISLDDVATDSRAAHRCYDLCDFGACKRITREADDVFHLAGIKGSVEVTESKPASFFVPLLQMNTNVLEACRVNKVERVVYTSSIGAYASAEVFVEGVGDDGPPMDLYPGWAKRMAEKQIIAYRKQYGRTNFSIVRPCNVYGPGDNFDPDTAMVIPSLMAKIKRGDKPVIVWGDGSAVRDFAFSRDIAEGVILALHYGTAYAPAGYVNLGGGQATTIRDLVTSLIGITGCEARFDASKPSGFPRRVMSIALACELMNYRPSTSLFDGLKETWNWYCAHSAESERRHNPFGESAA